MTAQKNEEPPDLRKIVRLVREQPTYTPKTRRALLRQFLGEIQDLAYQIDALLTLEEEQESRSRSG